MPLSRRYTRSCASNKGSMRSTLFTSRIIEFSITMSSRSSTMDLSVCQRERNLALELETLMLELNT